AKAGAMTLFYPKWIPGEHMPSGPIANLTGLHIFADGREVDWRRDLVETNAFAITVPSGAKTLSAKYDYVVPTGGGAFGSTASTNAKIAVINWYTVGLYPMGEDPALITVTATLKAPTGWKHGGSLDISGVDGSTIRYAPTSLEMLNDHPVLLGEHFRTITLWPAESAVGEHVIDVVADSDWALQFPQTRIEAYKRIVLEERAVFGDVGHYRKYHWLLTLSDNLGSFGVEHHECSDDRVAENTFVDDDAAKRSSFLLPHEFFHSWNGKARRPAGLVNGGYERPMKDDLLWVYEGLTNYYGELLAARADLISTAEWFDKIAADAMSVSHPGRTWRPLQDTADSSPFLYTAGGGWDGWRRGTDFYAEGSLIWLEADVTIRRLTNGKKTLDDFCVLFHGQNDNGKVWVKPYDADEVYRTLNAVAEYDWKGFFEKRLQSKSADIPLGGVENAGFKLVFNETANMFTDPEKLDGGLNAYGSLGIHVTSDGMVDDAWQGLPAYTADISNGMKIVAVNGRRFSTDGLKRAIAGSKDAKTPLEFIVDNGGYFNVVSVDYHGGLRYPHLERVAGANDVLTTISARRTQ
ncbi:MAG TPA: M61 family peptidase, partial [Thermoanaerobaculia bacterium]|nr:M61 family peptidase [Thermoanaerobaculia bacterium]